MDFQVLHYIDSVGLKILFDSDQQFKERGCRLVIAAPTPSVRKLLTILRMDKHIPAPSSLEEAAAVLRGKRP
jgi:anti-anti-sigma factor